MNLLDTLKENNVQITIEYYGKSDWITRLECGELIKYFESVKNIINDLEFGSIININDYINYLTLVKISSFSEIIDSIIAEENKSRILILSNLAQEKSKKISVQDLIKFINLNHVDLLNNKQLSFVTIDLCIKYQNGIQESVFIWLADNKPYVFINKYDYLKKQFIKTEIIERVLNEKNIDLLIHGDGEKFLRILKALSNKNLQLILTFNDNLYSFYQKMFNNVTIENVLQFFNLLKSIKRYFEDIKYSNANECNRLFQQVELLLDESIHKMVNFFLMKYP